jgi:hypothetical protein
MMSRYAQNSAVQKLSVSPRFLAHYWFPRLKDGAAIRRHETLIADPFEAFSILQTPPSSSTLHHLYTMSWRHNAGSTGANTIPLGTRRRFGGEDGPEENGTPPVETKRGRSPERKEPEYNPDGTKKRRKRNRWGDASDNKAAGLMNLPTAIEAPMTAEQLDAYVTHLRIEEISQKLRINDVVPADGDR